MRAKDKSGGVSEVLYLPTRHTTLRLKEFYPTSFSIKATAMTLKVRMPTFSMAQGMMVKSNVVVSGLGVTIGPEY